MDKNSFYNCEGGERERERGKCCITTDTINLIYISMICSLNQPNYKQGQARLGNKLLLRFNEKSVGY